MKTKTTRPKKKKATALAVSSDMQTQQDHLQEKSLQTVAALLTG